jgi:hypothetical protein
VLSTCLVARRKAARKVVDNVFTVGIENSR